MRDRILEFLISKSENFGASIIKLSNSYFISLNNVAGTWTSCYLKLIPRVTPLNPWELKV